MPRNTRNVWLEARIDGRANTLEGGPVSRDGGLSAVILQRQNGDISDYRFQVSTFTTGAGRIVTDARIETNGNRYGRPSLSLTTYRDKPGAVVTLDVPGLTSAAELSTSALLTFATPGARDAFLSLLSVWREAHKSAEVSA